MSIKWLKHKGRLKLTWRYLPSLTKNKLKLLFSTSGRERKT